MKERAPKVTHRLLLTAGRFCCHLMGSFFQYGHLGDSWLGKQKCRPGDQEAEGHQHDSHIKLHGPSPPPCEEARAGHGPQIHRASL